VVYSVLQLTSSDLIALAILIPVGILSERIVFRPPRGMEHTASTLVYLASVLLLRTPAAVVLTAVAATVAHLLLRKPWFKTAFNASQKALAIGAASLAWWLATDGAANPHDLLQKLPWAGLAGAILYFVNSWMTSIVVALDRRASLWQVWWEGRRQVLLPQLGMCALATLCAGAWLYDPRALLLLIVPAAVTWASFNQIRALEEKTATEQSLREETQRHAERWAALAGAGDRLSERIDPDSLLQIAAELMIKYCAEAVHIEVRGRRADAAQPDVPTPARDWLATAPVEQPSPPASLRLIHLRAGGGDVGTLHAAWITAEPTPEQLALLEPLADRIALALHNAVLVEQGAEVEALRQVSQMKNEFLAQVGHDLRSPLSLVVGFGELLKERPDDPGDVRFAAERIIGAGQQLSRLVDDLLEAGRLETGRFSLDIRPVDLRQVAQAALSVAQAAYGDHRYLLRTVGALPTIQSDDARLQQILVNLLTNAARYAPAGTAATVELSTDADGVRLAVEDEGPGVPPEERERIFEKFYRTSHGKEQTAKGLGLGLSICSDLVIALGGRIWVEGAPTGGARFVVRLPRAAQA
jgi:signal transduction histidine kinase